MTNEASQGSSDNKISDSEASEKPSRPIRQEAEKATEAIDELAPGVLRSQLPVELPGLGHVNCYILEDERGIAVIDPGLPGSRSFAVLEGRIKLAGFKLADIHTAVITHSHFDHFGGAERLRQETGADILTHESFRPAWEAKEARENPDLDAVAAVSAEDDLDQAVAEGKAPWERGGKTPWGTKRKPPLAADIEAWEKIGMDERKWFRTPTPSVTVVDSEIIKLARREWIAIHTPGHTGDHLCLWDPEHKIMVSGDHVLPTITPHIAGATSADDPLALFFQSLRRMSDFSEAELVLPAHGHPFHGLAERSDDIIEHHEERLDIIRKASDELGEAPVEEYMKELFSPRVWGDMASSEAYAHLLHLEVLSEMRSSVREDGVKLFAPA